MSSLQRPEQSLLVYRQLPTDFPGELPVAQDLATPDAGKKLRLASAGGEVAPTSRALAETQSPGSRAATRQVLEFGELFNQTLDQVHLPSSLQQLGQFPTDSWSKSLQLKTNGEIWSEVQHGCIDLDFRHVYQKVLGSCPWQFPHWFKLRRLTFGSAFNQPLDHAFWLKIGQKTPLHLVQSGAFGLGPF